MRSASVRSTFICRCKKWKTGPILGILPSSNLYWPTKRWNDCYKKIPRKWHKTQVLGGQGTTSWHRSVDIPSKPAGHGASVEKKTGDSIKSVLCQLLSQSMTLSTEALCSWGGRATRSFNLKPWGNKGLPSWFSEIKQTISGQNFTTLQIVIKGIFTKPGSFQSLTYIIDLSRY